MLSNTNFIIISSLHLTRNQCLAALFFFYHVSISIVLVPLSDLHEIFEKWHRSYEKKRHAEDTNNFM